ncbi:NitT/TauT family transport system ATP-binding protein [Oryzomicrobium terrae]|uniref:NitT/TauT family transport system ATP-binding protein n=1 Tax=Oryzomicrobium terrae TaxID=1735038 RepID=A0A5C1E6Y6_9RHOO|nr:NitT/TauT family transport system ATP-binding protein [Oryzomicrobium terrae]
MSVSVAPARAPAVAGTAPAGLSIADVSFAYAAGETTLRRVSLEVPEGTFLTLLGPSGSGKSTLLRLIAGLEAPSDGRLAWNGVTIDGPGIDRAVVFQNYALFPWYTVVDNVALAVAKAHPQARRAERRERAREYLAKVGLSDAAGKYPFQLSGGMQQRAAIARALALEAPVLLMDEPFGALDPINRGKLQDLLLDVWQSTSPRRTIVFVTHDVDEALYLGDQVAVLGASPGRLLAQVAVPFPRPRQRAQLFASAEFHARREEIAELLDADVLQGLSGQAA